MLSFSPLHYSKLALNFEDKVELFIALEIQEAAFAPLYHRFFIVRTAFSSTKNSTSEISFKK